jgi:hypothetical protein
MAYFTLSGKCSRDLWLGTIRVAEKGEQLQGLTLLQLRNAK